VSQLSRTAAPTLERASSSRLAHARKCRFFSLLLPLAASASLLSCSSGLVRIPLPESEAAYASAVAPPPQESGSIRAWGDEAPPWIKTFLDAPDKEIQALFPGVYGKRHAYLALSGGGENGAYGAGVLAGWTASGTRPEFTMVTGISTGSLIAPFAFLGPAYDQQLTDIYTKYSTDDLVIKRSVIGMISAASAVDTAPLKKIIASYVDANLINAIAAEHRKGRRLFVGTTNLDAGRPVMWNIGAIANSTDPRAPELIHKILLASASIPGAFPPVLINVEADGKVYDELHVDGGTTTQVFVYPVGIDWKAVTKKLKVPGRPDLYVIRNASLDPTYEPVKPKLVPIAGRSISSLIRTQGIGDTYRIYLSAQRDGLRYHLAFIPKDFDAKPEEAFDLAYMRQLYDVGYEQGKAGTAWSSTPPGFE
jgi:predicted patatin/cPLA2 family phospholipase